MDHFNHEHPLMLIDEAPKSEEKVVCYGCQKPILGSAYSCSECNYFLHNKCAQLWSEIKHPMHSQHPLTLFRQPPYYTSSCICSVCLIDNWKWFTYSCLLCEFDIHIQCIFDEDQEGVVEHECHDHPLMLVQRSALFSCDACFVEDIDLSYKCTTCPLWIHKTCASLPNTIKQGDHGRPLVLAYSLPDKFRNFEYLWNICHHKMHPSYWVYHCTDCRYFVHLKCAAKPKKEPLQLSCSECNYLLHNKCAQLLSEIKHPMHSQHPLTLLRQQPYYTSSYICSVCLIDNWKWFTYSCLLCMFDSHIQCILDENQEGMVEHECHDHPLILVQRSAMFCCDACGVEDKDSSHKCTICPFWIHNTCASLPNTIKHGDHDHPLVLPYSLPDKFRNFEYMCNICHDQMHASYWVYYCTDCRYFVHLKCAAKPKKEPLQLSCEIEAEDPNMMHFPMADGSVTKIVQEIVNSKDNDEIGTELLHFSHQQHPLHLSKATKDETICAGCVRPISTPFYDCEQGKEF